MSTQQCPQCQKIVSLEDRFCCACGAKLPQSSAKAPQNQPQESSGKRAASAATPSASNSSWRKHTDSWNGFSLDRPSGWEVRVTHDTITICQDLQGLTSATIRPVQLQQQVTAGEFARRLVEMLRANTTNFVAWQMKPEEKTYSALRCESDQTLLRIRFTQEGQELVGVLSVVMNGNAGLVSGFQAPPSVIEKMKPTFQRILASFASIPRMPRTRFVEGSEQAFSALIPHNWQATGSLLRTPEAGVIFRFHATNPDKTLSIEVPGSYMFFQEEIKGWLGKLIIPQKYPIRPHIPATTFLEQVTVPELRQRYPDLRVERIVNRPDLASALVADAFQLGEWIQPKLLTVAGLQCTFTENGVSYRQRRYIAVQKWPMMPVWRVMIGCVIRALQDQFVTYCAILEGIAESVRPEMQWVQLQRQRAQQMIGAFSPMPGAQQPWLPGAAMSMPSGMPQGGQGMSPQDQMAMQQAWQQAQLKQLEIMRNANQQIFQQHQAGMQRRMAMQDHQFQQFDQVIRGYQSMYNPYSGAQYEVPIGYNNYWANGLDQVVGSNWSGSPGLNFQRLDPMP
jgi:hypothetical protein